MNEQAFTIHEDEATRWYWENCKQEKLVIQYCNECKRFQYPPNLVCRKCLSDNLSWQESVGEGEVYSYSVVHRTPYEFLKSYVPYTVALVKLKENVMVETWIVESNRPDQPELKIGSKVKVTFKDFGSYKLPVFTLIN